MARKKGTSTVPKNESKDAKFVRLANQRINKILKMYRQISQLGGAAYESTSDQRKKIKDVLENGLSSAIDGMNKVKIASNDFKL